MKKETKEVAKATKQNSKSYTVRAFNSNVQKLGELELINKEELENLKKLQMNIMQRFMGFDLGIEEKEESIEN